MSRFLADFLAGAFVGLACYLVGRRAERSQTRPWKARAEAWADVAREPLHRSDAQRAVLESIRNDFPRPLGASYCLNLFSSPPPSRSRVSVDREQGVVWTTIEEIGGGSY
jgi:hypothetical protein